MFKERELNHSNQIIFQIGKFYQIIEMFRRLVGKAQTNNRIFSE